MPRRSPAGLVALVAVTLAACQVAPTVGRLPLGDPPRLVGSWEGRL